MGFWNDCVSAMNSLGKATGVTIQSSKKAWATTEKFTQTAWTDAAQAYKEGLAAFERGLKEKTVNPKHQ